VGELLEHGLKNRFGYQTVFSLVVVDGGLPRLTREFNQQFPAGSARRLEDPDDLLAIPRFAP
jgi:hypothetical protein